jgi:ABC-type glutathione transport system ATPase component
MAEVRATDEWSADPERAASLSVRVSGGMKQRAMIFMALAATRYSAGG